MKGLTKLLLSAAIVALTGCSDSEDAPKMETGRVKFEPIDLNDSEVEIVKKQNSFSLGLFGKIYEEDLYKTNNFMLSPLSVSMALSMIANGAQGQTMEEIVNTLGFEGMDMEAINRFNHRMAGELAEADRSTSLSLAGSIWIDRQIEVYDSFISDNREYFGAEIFDNVELCSEDTRNAINSWASEKTRGMIPEFLKKPLNSAVMYVMNALYFKSTWAHKFDKALTAEGTFHNADGSEGHPMMMKATQYGFSACHDDNGGASWAGFTYGNGAYELMTILPDPGVTLAGYLTGLTEEDVAKMTNRYFWRPYEGTIVFPKMEISTQLQLEDLLKSLGIVDAFSDGEADFSKISPMALYINGVQHDTRIIFNEEGTEAAAVTGMGMDMANGNLMSSNLTFDRPFAFQIRERSTGTILFMGCVNKL